MKIHLEPSEVEAITYAFQRIPEDSSVDIQLTNTGIGSVITLHIIDPLGNTFKTFDITDYSVW